MSALVEAMARAIHDAMPVGGGATKATWEQVGRPRREMYLRDALAALKAMKEHGPTQKMAWAYELPHVGPDECAAMFDAMLQAAIDEVEL